MINWRRDSLPTILKILSKFYSIFSLFLFKNKQMAPQDLSTMLRLGQRNIIFLINNGGYTIEVEIHDGPYNVIKNWDYTGLVEAMHNQTGNCWTTKVCFFKQSIVNWDA